MRASTFFSVLLLFVGIASAIHADDVKTTETYARIRKSIDSVSAINTHDHLMPFDRIGHRNKTDRGEGMTLRSIWAGSYFTWVHPLEPWPNDGAFETWWSTAQHNFSNARATSFYRYLLPAFQDLYGVDFDTITPAKARDLNDRIFDNYKTDEWLHEVITERANIELMVIDPYWARLACETDYSFAVTLCNVTSLVRGFHSSEFTDPLDDPYAFAEKHDMSVQSLDEYVVLLDRLVAEAREKGAVCLKTTLAYERTLQFENVTKAQANKVFGRPRKDLTSEEI